MRSTLFHAVLAATLLSAGAAMAKETNEQKRDTVRKMAAETLDQLYKLQQASRTVIQKSAGICCFRQHG